MSGLEFSSEAESYVAELEACFMEANRRLARIRLVRADAWIRIHTKTTNETQYYVNVEDLRKVAGSSAGYKPGKRFEVVGDE